MFLLSRSALVPLIVVFLGVCAVGVPSAHADFTKQEQRKLDQGKLVTRYERKALGDLKLVGGTSWLVIDATPSEVWARFRQFEQYHRFLPQCDSSKIVGRTKAGVVLRLQHSEGPINAVYHMTVTPNETIRAAQFRLSTNYDNDIREGWGFVKISAYKGGKALVSYGVMADVGTGILAGTVRPSIHEWMLKVPKLFKEDLRRAAKRKKR